MSLKPITKLTLEKVQQEFANYNFIIHTPFDTIDTRLFSKAVWGSNTLTLTYKKDDNKTLAIKSDNGLRITVVSKRNFLPNQIN